MAGEVAEKSEGGASMGQKRQRRPSVRLGEIGGDKPLVSYTKPTASSSKTRPLTNLVSSSNDDDNQNWSAPQPPNEDHSEDNEDQLQTPGLDPAVRTWLLDLGLPRYAPVFEIHEVDHQVLPLLTLDDLKDMGINAVGTRRKLYAAILNLRKALPSSF